VIVAVSATDPPNDPQQASQLACIAHRDKEESCHSIWLLSTTRQLRPVRRIRSDDRGDPRAQRELIAAGARKFAASFPAGNANRYGLSRCKCSSPMTVTETKSTWAVSGFWKPPI